MASRIDRIGEKIINTQGMEMEIIKYRNVHDIDIRFSDGTIDEHKTYNNFKKGSIINYNVPSYLGVGYRGYGTYKSRIGNVKTEEYIKWSSMLTRCYSDKYKYKSNYIDCEVCDEWKNFQNFAEWYHKNKYIVPDLETLELDKDIKIKGNKIYSPDACILIPRRLNTVILNRYSDRGNACIGVYYREKDGKYIAECNTLKNTNRYLGTYNTEIEAFNRYKYVKEKEIYNVLQLYKEYIPEDVYQSILNYKIDITD